MGALTPYTTPHHSHSYSKFGDFEFRGRKRGRDEVPVNFWIRYNFESTLKSCLYEYIYLICKRNLRNGNGVDGVSVHLIHTGKKANAFTISYIGSG